MIVFLFINYYVIITRYNTVKQYRISCVNSFSYNLTKGIEIKNLTQIFLDDYLLEILGEYENKHPSNTEE